MLVIASFYTRESLAGASLVCVVIDNTDGKVLVQTKIDGWDDREPGEKVGTKVSPVDF